MKTKRSHGIIFYVLFCLLVIVFMSELVLRINPIISKNKRHLEWLRSMMTYDELLGWKHVSNASVWSESLEYVVQYNINSKGLRDVEHSYDKIRGEFRIICLGDSITFGWGVSSEARFSSLLNNYFTNVEVINMGVQGYGIDQELLFLKQEGIKYSPDLIILYLIPDDLVRACYSKMWDRPKPRFILNNKNAILTNIPVPKVDLFSFHNPTLDQIRYYLANKSYLFWLFQDKIYLWRESRIKSRVNTEDVKIELAKVILTDIKRAARLCNAQLLIVGDLPEKIKVFLQESSIYFCEDPLLFYSGNQADVRYVEFNHPNNLGHKIIAEGIYNFLTLRRLIPEKYLIKK